MEKGLLTWKEFLATFKVGDKFKINDNETSGAYGGIADTKAFMPDAKFSIRTDPLTEIKYLIRIK